ncbi:hypothetical protein [Mycobacterium sp. PSTR-4-N]|uniref:hypothetical protein n=1 Tax=Mycobacterium sp. PSTR-4-N TaxID=2917745 RepID=UPI001F1545E3|nr:hypothetical protein [Mycobacterium sp. PSTR-4-N]MCG7595934.1 hypothetical protein [Mycobacterium sp. PSTR-4-N]
MKWGELGQWGLTIGLTLVISLATRYLELPKLRGEGKKAGAEGAKAEADADLVDVEARIREWNEHIRLARDAQHSAEEARDGCRASLGRSLSALESVLDASDRTLSLIERLMTKVAPESLTTQDHEDVNDLRATFRTARRELWELRP